MKKISTLLMVLALGGSSVFAQAPVTVTGKISVGAAGALTSAGLITVNNAAGELITASGGIVNANGGLTVTAGKVRNVGTLNTATGAIAISADSIINAGTLSTTTGAVNVTGTGVIKNTGTFTPASLTVNVGTATDVAVDNQGTINAPGKPVTLTKGELKISGSIGKLQAGTLTVEKDAVLNNQTTVSNYGVIATTVDVYGKVNNAGKASATALNLHASDNNAVNGGLFENLAAGDLSSNGNVAIYAADNATLGLTPNQSGLFKNDGAVALNVLDIHSNSKFDGIILPLETQTGATTVTSVKLHKAFVPSTDDYDWNTNVFWPPYPIEGTVTYSGTGGAIAFQDESSSDYTVGNVWFLKYNGDARAATGGSAWSDYLTAFSSTDGGYTVNAAGSDAYIFPLQAGKGGDLFKYATGSVTVKDYTSTVNAGQAAWNLIGSPFGAPLFLGNEDDDHLALSANPDWTQEVYYLLSTGKWIGYSRWDGVTVNIPPYASFFIQAPNNTVVGQDQTLDFNPAGLGVLNAAPNDFRSVSQIDADVLRLTLSNDADEDKAIIVLGDQYKDEFNLSNADATKFTNDGKYVQLWSAVGSIPAEVNALSRGNKAIQLGATLPTAGEYTLGLKSVVNEQNFSSVVLEDNGVAVADLLAGESYTFNAAATTNTDRFVLRVGQAAEVDAIGSLYAYAENGQLVVKGLTAGDKVAVYNVSGQLVASSVASSDVYSTAVAKGVYLVKVAGQVLKVLSK
ncbi:MAG: DUF6383 domain-containing protein [Candidatus Symbiothrix sp.]|jgi:hypothetical protein|nr:DUF6383 domain-containing protein [Candidatus Symbiothrix sp.]